MNRPARKMTFKQKIAATRIFLKSVFTKEITFEKISLHGDAFFIHRVIEALELLKERSSDAYDTVKDNIDTIYQGVDDRITTIGKGPGALIIDVMDQSTAWIAGKIYYESKRISLIHKIRAHGRLFMAPKRIQLQRSG